MKSVNRAGKQECARRLPEAIETAIERAKVKPGEDRYKKLLELARRIKGLRGVNCGDRSLMKRIVLAWNAKSCHAATGRYLAELPKAFLRRLQGVTTPTGTHFAQFVDAASRLPTPRCAVFYEDKPALVLLVKLCSSLDDNASGNGFPLSVRQARDAVGGSRSDVHRMLQRLETDQVIRVVEKGVRGTTQGKATTWEYVGDKQVQGPNQ